MSETPIANLPGSSRTVGSGAAVPLDVAIVDGSGNQITTFGGSGGTASNFGAAFPTAGTAVGAKDSAGVNMAALNLDASGNLKVAGTLSTTPPAAGTATLSNVADSAVSVTVLAANVNRLAFALYNDSTAAVDVKFGITASATSFTKRLLPSEYLATKDVGVNYTGRIDAIWDSAAGGAMRVTELTA